MKRLLIVESPTKARTIGKFLPVKDYRIEASMGHVRDLPARAAEIPARYKKEPWARLGVRTDNGFEPIYVVPADKKGVVRSLRAALKDATELFIATDEDREGESIGWHLLEVLKPKVPVRRMVFHQITRSAIERALDNTRDINRLLVEAQETRRVLDRLVGYTISPVLWKKIAPRLAAGRVQSVAVRLLVRREQQRIAFVPASYWDLAAALEADGAAFKADLTHLGGLRVATGRDFDDNTGELKPGLVSGENVLLLSEAGARRLERALVGAPWHVAQVNEKEKRRTPAPPFITSTLQQEASRKLRMSAKRTMRTAQNLYQKGHITYMRTDSVQLSGEAIEASRRVVEARYGKEYLSPGPRRYSSQVRNAQEAHEAIRPAGSRMRTVRQLELKGDEARLYDLIWKRTVATQMAQCVESHVTVGLQAEAGEDTARFRAAGKTILFPGFIRAYVEGSDDPAATIGDRSTPLPKLAPGDRPACRAVTARGHETKPPARFTEASLIKKLEAEGIGRPSTYASIIGTIQERGSARSVGTQLVPTFTAFATNRLLENRFSRLVDTDFTAKMEQELDDIATGKEEATLFLRRFFKGENGLEQRALAALGEVDARDVSTLSFPQWDPFVVRVGRYGPYVEGELDGKLARATVPEDLLPADATMDVFRDLIGAALGADEELGRYEGQAVYLKQGRYGRYIQLGEGDSKTKPKRISVPKTVKNVSFEDALKLLSLPRELGQHPETGKPVTADIGRYGPYVQHEGKFASIKAPDDVFAVQLQRGLELLAAKKRGPAVLRVIGKHPETGKEIEVREGRYGRYVRHEKRNAKLKKEQSAESITMEEALELLAAAKASGPRRRRRRAAR